MKTVESNFTIKTPVRLANPGGEFWRIHDAKGLMIVDEINIRHRAESIVLALNAYPDLLEACRADLHDLQEIRNSVDGLSDDYNERKEVERVLNLIDGRMHALRSVIALATNNATKE